MLNFVVTVSFLARSVTAHNRYTIKDQELNTCPSKLDHAESSLACRSIVDSHIYKNMSVNTDECEEACKEDPRCASYNFKLDNDFNEICELNECGLEENSLDDSISTALRKLRPAGSFMASITQQVRSVKDKGKCKKCQAGYHGEGIMCKDKDECRDGTHKCSLKATCNNTEGSYKCKCFIGFTGDGISCKDIDECAAGTHNCSQNATCNNTEGSHKCKCLPGFTGDGVTCKVCPTGFTEYNSSCYIVIDRPTNRWQDARKTCQNLGGDLVKISSAGENTFIFQLANNTLKHRYLWIGLVRGESGAFYWVDGAPLSGSYSNWEHGEPSNSNGIENCGEMYIATGQVYTSQWNDIPCDGSHSQVIACENQK